jgi:hypothetical protein
MARRRLLALRRALRTSHESAQPPVHFHNGAQGRPAVCFDEGCGRPRLEVG